MEARMIAAGGQQIATFESGGMETAVVLVHGNSASSETFRPQVEGALGQKYRVIAMDLPGHGASEQAADPAATYHMPGYAAVLVEVAQKLGVEDGVFVGWSLGGHIVLEAAKLLPAAKGFVIFGTPPLAYPPAMEEAFLPNPNMAAAFSNELTQAQMEGFAAACLAPNTTLDLAPFVADIAKTDGRARETMGASVAPGNYEDEVNIVREMKRPLAILHGEQEQLVNEAYISKLEMPTLWRGAVQLIKDSGHTPQMEQSEEFSRLIDEFVQELN